ncbi:MAG: hypothetical protein NXH82_05505 [Rhodobacteraceae bacterium]|nr:hypothetical protein [Paracoccaceae bacterium]
MQNGYNDLGRGTDASDAARRRRRDRPGPWDRPHGAGLLAGVDGPADDAAMPHGWWILPGMALGLLVWWQIFATITLLIGIAGG